MSSPDYYATGGVPDSKTDVYDAEIALYGFDYWYAHVSMEVMQYLFRAPYKEQFLSDLKKVEIIAKRIQMEYEKRAGNKCISY